MNLNIRPATIGDVTAISELVSQLAEQFIAPSLGEGGLESLLSSLDTESTRRRILDGWPHFCAADGNDVVGVIVVRPPTHLYHLFVRSNRQRTGIGTMLFAVADDHTVGNTTSRLATVNASLNAIRAYERLGFSSHGPVVDVDGVRFQPMVRTHAGWRRRV